MDVGEMDSTQAGVGQLEPPIAFASVMESAHRRRYSTKVALVAEVVAPPLGRHWRIVAAHAAVDRRHHRARRFDTRERIVVGGKKVRVVAVASSCLEGVRRHGEGWRRHGGERP